MKFQIGNLYYHKDKNIFFNNDELYIQLMKTSLLPFIKLKRIIADKNTHGKIDAPNKINMNLGIV